MKAKKSCVTLIHNDLGNLKFVYLFFNMDFEREREREKCAALLKAPVNLRVHIRLLTIYFSFYLWQIHGMLKIYPLLAHTVSSPDTSLEII